MQKRKKLFSSNPPCFSIWEPTNYTDKRQINNRKTEFINICLLIYAGETQ